MRKIILSAIFVIVAISANAQLLPNQPEEVFTDARKGYYVKDGVLHTVFIYDDDALARTRMVRLPAQNNHTAASFTPDEIEAYGIYGISRYISTDIVHRGVAQKVFLEELAVVNDTLALYYLQRPSTEKSNLYFIAEYRDDKWHYRSVEDNHPEEMWKLFGSLSDCGEMPQLRFLPRKLQRKNVMVYYRAFSDCNPRLFPTVKGGVLASFSMKSMVLYDQEIRSFPFNPSYSAGFFVQIPIDEGFSINPEVYYTGYVNRVNNTVVEATLRDVVYKRTALDVDLMLRYTLNYSMKKLIPYFEVGPIIDIPITEKYTNYIPYDVKPVFYGAGMGAGMEYKITKRNSFYFGLRFNYVTTANKDTKINTRSIELRTAFSIF